MKRWTLPNFRRTAVIVATVLVAACGQKAPTTSTSASTSQFPGYQQVGQSGDAAQLWFNPGEILRQGQGYEIHTLKTFPGGSYARFDVLTNCRDTTLRMAGTQYRSDGTADKAYPGNDTAVAAQSEPGMGQLMQTACTVAMASRAIPGDFNVPAALELLYGPYDEQAKTAKWSDAAVPKDLPWAQNLGFTPGDTLYVKGVATFDFNEGGKQKKVLVTSARESSEAGGESHISTALLGISIFVKDGTSWKVEANEPYVASLGEWGNVGDLLSWVAAGDNSYALVVHNSDMSQGIQSVATDVFVRDTAGKFHQEIADADTDMSEQEGVNVDTSFIKGRDPQHYDVKVSFTYTMPGQKTYVADHLYAYANGKYVLTRKDDPPKFAQPANPLDPSASPAVSSTDSSAPISVPVSATTNAAPLAQPVAFAGSADTTLQSYVNQMLEAAGAGNLPAVMQVVQRMDSLPKPARGNRTAARALNAQGITALNASNYVDAVRLFEQAAAVDPGDEEVQSNLAFAYSLSGNYAQAQSAATVALSLNPKRTSTWSPLARTFTKIHDRPRALEAMWLAYQFSGDKLKTLNFMKTKLQTETDPDMQRLFSDSIAWFEQGKTPDGL